MGVNGPISEQELATIEARAAAAPAGPWHATHDAIWHNLTAPRRGNTTGQGYIVRRDGLAKHANTVETLDFIAAAREDVPRLAAEVRRLRGLAPVGFCGACNRHYSAADGAHRCG